MALERTWRSMTIKNRAYSRSRRDTRVFVMTMAMHVPVARTSLKRQARSQGAVQLRASPDLPLC